MREEQGSDGSDQRCVDGPLAAWIAANREIEKRLGKAPGAEVLMSLALEKDNPMEFVEDYCDILLQKPQT